MKQTIDNEYYTFEQDNMPRYSFNEKDFEGGGMYNGYYEVFFKHSKPATYSIRRIDEADIHGKKNVTRNSVVDYCCNNCAHMYIRFYKKE